MKSATSKLCTILDVNMVAGACMLGVFAGMFGDRHVMDLNRRLNEVNNAVIGDVILDVTVIIAMSVSTDWQVDDLLRLVIGDVRRVDRRCQRVLIFSTHLVIMVMLLGEFRKRTRLDLVVTLRHHMPGLDIHAWYGIAMKSQAKHPNVGRFRS